MWCEPPIICVTRMYRCRTPVQLGAYFPIESTQMNRVTLIISMVLAMVVALNAAPAACLCGPGMERAQTLRPAAGCHDDQGKQESKCCSSGADDERVPADDPGQPGSDKSEPCPCLAWSDAPLSTFESISGLALVKRTLELTPILLLEAAPTPVACGAADTIRARSHDPRDSSTRLQAWLCVWTT